MIAELQTQNFLIKSIEGDGNCLFRSISHQLYGRQDYHREIRLLCMKYIQNERGFFQDYVTEDLNQYVRRKSQDGIWGDDVEIQALSQIYGRPIQIFATSSKPLRTFHEDNSHQIEPIRLAYVGFCHYNSIKRRQFFNSGLLDRQFGEYQEIFLTAYQNKTLNSQSDINRYRSFFSNSNGLDYALEQNVEASERKEGQITEQQLLTFENQQINQAIQISEAQNILEQIQKSEMKQIQNKYEQEQLQEELKRIEEREMELVKELSKKVKKDPQFQRPYWFSDLLSQGFREQEILFAIQINGYDPDLVQNFLLDNM